jgi:hypothetical protein
MRDADKPNLIQSYHDTDCRPGEPGNLQGVGHGLHALRMARDSQYTSSFSPRHHERAPVGFAHASMGPPAFYDCRDSVARCDLDYNLFRGWTAMVGSGNFSFPRCHFSLLSTRTQHTCLTLVPSPGSSVPNRRTTDFVLRPLRLEVVVFLMMGGLQSTHR